MNWQGAATLIAAYAGLFGGIYAVVTRPIENRLIDVIDRLKRIEEKLDDHSQRIVRLEERRFK